MTTRDPESILLSGRLNRRAFHKTLASWVSVSPSRSCCHAASERIAEVTVIDPETSPARRPEADPARVRPEVRRSFGRSKTWFVGWLLTPAPHEV